MRQRASDSCLTTNVEVWVISIAQDHLCNLKSIVLFNHKKPDSRVVCISVTIDAREAASEGCEEGFFQRDYFLYLSGML